MKIFKEKKSLYLTLIIVFILAAAASVILWQHLHSGPGTIAKIYQDGKLVREVDLTYVDSPFSFTIKSSAGGYNTIQVESGKIGVSDTDCPDKVCQRMGMVSSTAYPISCLPHKLIIHIENSTPSPDGLDAITR